MSDSSAFVDVFLPLQGDLLAYALSVGVPAEDAEDVLQDVARVMIEKIGEYRPGTNARAWAYAVLRNELSNYFRRSRRRALTLTDEALARIDRAAASEDESRTSMLRGLTRCLQQLSVDARRLIDMRYADRLQLPLIAEKLGRPVESVYVTLSRIRKRLRMCIEGHAEPAEETP